MDGNLDREAITDDLESMKKAGIGYVLFLEVNVGVPRGKVDFLSEEWRELYRHAVKEAERLGIRIILGSGPGWAGSGGPWDVSFDTTWGGPGISVFDTLIDWSKRPEDAVKFYSGIAIYSKTFSLSENAVSINKSDIYLDLGRVKNLARVKINGKDIRSSLDCPLAGKYYQCDQK